MSSFTKEDIAVGRLVSEDDDFLLIEFPKDNDHVFHLDGDAEEVTFFTVLFIAFDEDGEPDVTKPWEKE